MCPHLLTLTSLKQQTHSFFIHEDNKTELDFGEEFS